MTLSGGALNRNSHTPSAAQSAASASRYEHLAEREAHVADAEHVNGQRRGRILERDDLDRVGVGRDRGDLARMQPLDAGEAQTGHLSHVADAVAVDV